MNLLQPDLSHITTLEQLRAAVDAFELPGLKTPHTRLVFADGNPQARILLIGEAPGAEEDRLGKPFVGRSGQLLDKMLAAIGLDRTTVYITNTVFWRPQDNRTPTPAETASCRPFLDRHIALINPALILLVGGTAVKTVLETKTGITQLRQQWQMLNNPYREAPYPALPLFHPAYLLRNPPAKKEAWEDLQLFRDRAVELGLLTSTATEAKQNPPPPSKPTRQEMEQKAQELYEKRQAAKERFEELSQNPGMNPYPSELEQKYRNAEINETAHQLGYDRAEAEKGKLGRIK